MTIKVLGGLAKGRSLFVPRGEKTRPTSVLLKRRIFDAYQDLRGRRFVDLCAGSGAMGLEAWSRGAAQVTLIEVEKRALKAIEANIQAFQESFSQELLERPLLLKRGRVEKFVDGLEGDASTIIFLDPPYELHKLYQDVGMRLLTAYSHCDIWIESDRQKGLPLSFWEKSGFIPDKVYAQGTSYLAVFRKQ